MNRVPVIENLDLRLGSRKTNVSHKDWDGTVPTPPFEASVQRNLIGKVTIPFIDTLRYHTFRDKIVVLCGF